MYQLVRKPQDKVEIELVNTDGKVLVQRPISVQELLHQEDHTMHVGNGVSVRLEEYRQQHHQPHVGTSAKSKSYLPEPQLMTVSHNTYNIHHNNDDDSVSEHLSSTSESYFDESTDNIDAGTNTTSKPRHTSNAAHHTSDTHMEKFEEYLLEQEPQAKAIQASKRTSSSTSSSSSSSKSSQSSTSTDAHIQYANETSNTGNNDEEASLRKE